MRRLTLLSIISASACASGGATQSAVTRTPVAIYESPETGTLFANRAPAAAVSIDAAQPTVWLAVKKVYADLEIPVTVQNPASHQIGNDNIVKSRQMAGKPMTAWIDCGSGLTGEKALEYRIYASMLTDVVSDGKGGTTVRTTLVPYARDMASGTADRIVCTTTGRLEQEIVDRVKASLGHSSGH
ncbi:MAG TPA: hypothetical protein VGM50_09390 [Gemmatimonadaceae bacterium]